MKLGTVISSMLDEMGIGAQVRRNMAPNLFAEVAGPAMSRHVTAERMEGTTLVVRAKSPAWRSEVSFLRDELVRRLNQKIGNVVVKDIRIL